MLQERYRRQPWKRPASATDATVDPKASVEHEMVDNDTAEPAGPPDEPDAFDEADALAAMPDADFMRSLRRDIEGVREGTTPSMVAAQRQSPKDRPWARHHKRRDKRGKAF